METTFGQYLASLIAGKGQKFPEIYNKIWMSRQTFHKILNGRGIPRKENVCHIALSMRLTKEETVEMLRQAGYGLSDFIPYDRQVLQLLLSGYSDNELADFVISYGEAA